MYSDSEWQKANENLQAMANGVQNVVSTVENYKQAKETREREDNATQRRVDDLKKAGLSPTLAAGSPAQASATPSLSGSAIGAWLDAKNGIEQYKQNREFTEQAKMQSQIMRYQRESANRANVLDNLAFQWQTGGQPKSVLLNPVTGNYELDWNSSRSDIDPETHRVWRHNDLLGTPIMQGYQMGLDNAIYQNQMLGKENAWYNFNQGLDAVATGVGLGLNAFSTFGSYGLKKASQAQQFDMFQQELNRRQNYDNWRTSPHSTYYSNNRGFSSYYQYR